MLLAGLLSALALPVAADNQSAQKEVQLIAEAAEAAVAKGQWSEALPRWEAALEKIVDAQGDDEFRAILYYEHGRAAGVLCDWEKAQMSLSLALELDRQTQGPFFMSLLELARMNMAQQNYQQAKGYYDQLLPELKARDAAVLDPIGSAEIVSEYALALEKLGAEELAKPYREMAEQWRDKHAGIAAETTKTPYGSRCGGSGPDA
jgi:tetratricopeptide (TPR) repeat protein